MKVSFTLLARWAARRQCDIVHAIDLADSVWDDFCDGDVEVLTTRPPVRR